MAASDYAKRRLLKDLQEVLENPLPNVVGKPLDEDIFIWHVNVRADDDNQLSGGTFHLTLIFPLTYPSEGPEIRLGSPLPHPNVNLVPGVRSWKVSLWDCIPGFKGWTSAYSAQSVFLQLQTFLLREDLQYDTRAVNQDLAVQRANAFKCSECPHKGIAPFPAFPSQEELDGALSKRKRLLVSRPVISRVLRSLKHSEPTVQHSTSLDHGGETRARDVENNLEDSEEGWELVSGKKVLKASEKAQSFAGQALQTGRQDRNYASSIGGSELVVDQNRWHHIDSLPGLDAGNKETAVDTPPEVLSSSATSTTDYLICSKNATYPRSKLSKTAKKNLARMSKRKAAREFYERNQTNSSKVAECTTCEVEANETESAKDMKQSTTIDKNCFQQMRDEAMGLFGPLPVEALTTILSRLATNDLASLSMTCHGMREACEDGFVWKEILHRQFPATSLQAATLSDWKHAYMMESSNITRSLQCFHSKATYEEDVLGYPITFTVNPRTQSVDYIEVSFDLLSQTAYAQQKVRTTADNEDFQLLLPVYINQQHFERALPLIMKTGRALCPEMKVDRFQPDMVLSFMPKLLNTMVVLLCDKGIAASERATDGFCMLHRLFLALCDRFKLWKEVERRVLEFQKFEKARSKDHCPNMGEFITMLSVCSSQETSWPAVIRLWIGEVFDRGVIWVCKNYANLVKNHKVHPTVGGVDEELLKASWDGRKVGLRIAMFHSGFLHLVARPPGVSLHKIAVAYDALYGMASLPLKKRVQEFLKKTIEVDSWPEFFKVVCLQSPSKEHLTGWLRQCWINSIRKGYHNNNTDFSSIQRSGVSKILLKGETTSLSVKSKVQMLEKWRYTAHVQYLDASCLLYDFDGRFIEVIDYCHIRGQTPGIEHSGDRMDFLKQEGTHVININLGRLGHHVKEMYFTMSGWMGARLKDIRLPFVQLLEESTGKELCEYHLEDKNTGQHRAVVMCRVYRNGPIGSSANWYVEAIGQLGAGAAENYAPIMEMIEARIRSKTR